MAFFGKRILPFRNRKKDIPGGLWESCPSCKEMLYLQEMKEALGVCTHCNHHFSLAREERIAMFADEGSFEEWDEELISVDTLKFTGTASYSDKLVKNQAKTGYNDAISCGKARMSGFDIGLGVMDFKFLGASMGAVVGEKVTRLIERSTEAGMPVVLVCASGGARMYEGLFSLMQMAKTSGALARHAEAGLPYIPILTHPTTAGVMASFATLGDVIIAEPEALIGFAGPRVIKETTQQDLPDGFQRSEFLLKHGLLDMIVHRHDLKERVADLLTFWMPESARRPVPVDGPMGIEQADVVEAPTEKTIAKRLKKSARKADDVSEE
ncbi:MAG: acetyl-CoA carboxylase carboxyl transferase subunit beta [Candidatus Omnitrophota bacterium]|jgi:acetyl-CoA carboxylase carboxyl transferase subunit beta